MREPMKKSAKITLGILIAVLLIGVCFTSVAIYAKKELSKPRFTLPEQAPLPSASALPADAAEAESYIDRLFAETTAADDVEGKWSTEVSLDGDWNTPLNDADERVLRYIGTNAFSLYPTADAVCMAQADDVPMPMRDAAEVSFTARQGSDEKDDEKDRYFITLEKTSTPSSDIFSDSAVFSAVRQTLSPALEILQVEVTSQDATENYTVDRVTDNLLSAELKHTYHIRATVRLTGAYRALLPEQETFVAEFPYTTKQKLEFRHYGVRFTEQAVAVKPGDRQSLPTQVTVDDTISAEEYNLTFTPDVPDVLSFDDDGVMRVLKLCDKPVTVTMTLQHGEHSYTDSIKVYITEWEVASDV